MNEAPIQASRYIHYNKQRQQLHWVITYIKPAVEVERGVRAHKFHIISLYHHVFPNPGSK